MLFHEGRVAGASALALGVGVRVGGVPFDGLRVNGCANRPYDGSGVGDSMGVGGWLSERQCHAPPYAGPGQHTSCRKSSRYRRE